tara:strand:- start:1079 stop:2476 length:1398 start_codon:yes stop_codon:yes gene_type:complete
MSIIIPANSAISGGFDVANSLMFNSADSAYLSRSQGTATLAYKYTLSMWIKRSKLNSEMYLTGVSSGTVIELMKFPANNTLEWYNRDAASNVSVAVTSNVFQDTSAWMHLVFSYDSSQSTPATQKKLYINGVNQTFASNVGLATNAVPGLNLSGANIKVGAEYSPGYYYGGYMSEVNFIDGQALAADSFGEFDEDSGIWKPINASGLTFGNNGFYLDFEDSSNLGNDASGGTDFSESNIASTDQATDTCTNNFATMNIIDAGGPSLTFSNGNTTIVSSDNTWRSGFNTIAPSKGKWYFEAKYVGSSTNNWIGVVDTEQVNSTSNTGDFKITDRSRFYGISQTGQKGNNGSESSWGSSYSQNDIVGVAFDLDNHKIYFSKDGTFQNSGNPESGATGTGSMYDLATGYFYMVGSSYYSTSASISYNFGSPYFAISSGNSDADGHGNFEYAVPSGYFALCTKNLAEYG